MTDDTITINSITSLAAGIARINELSKENKYLTFSWRIGEDRSLDQNALFHVWLTLYAAHLLKKDRRLVTAGELAGMKRAVKAKYYNHNPQPWMIHQVTNPMNTAERKRDYTSSKTWKRGEIFLVLNFVQMVAAQDGLVLESTGQFGKLQREQAA